MARAYFARSGRSSTDQSDPHPEGEYNRFIWPKENV